MARSVRRALAAGAVAGVVGLGGVAGGVPRDSGTGLNLESDVAGSGSALGFGVTAPSYTARFVRIQGSLTSLVAGSGGNEATLRIFPTLSSGRAEVLVPVPLNVFTGTTAVDAFVRLGRPMPVTAGDSMIVSTIDIFDNGPGPDARWDNLTVTMNDGPPPAVNLGPIEPRRVGRSFVIGAGQTVWLRFDVGTTISGLAFLDIDTFGSSIGSGVNAANDTELALYNEDGVLVAQNDDTGQPPNVPGFRWSLLSFGAGGGATGVGTLSATGQQGALAAGTYWLAVKAFGNDSASVGWDVQNFSTLTGTARVNIRANTGGAAWCVADWNRNGTWNIDDIFEFLNAWFAGCP